jgi:hypothetical protein
MKTGDGDQTGLGTKHKQQHEEASDVGGLPLPASIAVGGHQLIKLGHAVAELCKQIYNAIILFS